MTECASTQDSSTLSVTRFFFKQQHERRRRRSSSERTADVVMFTASAAEYSDTLKTEKGRGVKEAGSRPHPPLTV